jgi:hypothetical protein
MENAITEILKAIGENPEREGLKDTPRRVRQSYEHLMQGYKQNPDEIFAHILKNFHEIGKSLINPPVLEDLRVHYPQYWKRIDQFRMGKAENLIKAFLHEKNVSYTREIEPRTVTAAVLAGIQAVVNPDFLIKNGLTFETTITSLLEFYKHGFVKE